MEGIVLSQGADRGERMPSSSRASACEAEVLDAVGLRHEWTGTAALQPAVRLAVPRLARAAEARVAWERLRD